MTDQKVAFITGANRGIGLETARQLGKQGIAVVLGARDLVKGEAAAAQLKSEGIDAAVLHYDAEDAGSPKEAYEFFDKNYGKLDILINNAAVMLFAPTGGDGVETITPEILRQTFEVNVFAVVFLTQALLPLIKKAPAGRIVNLSSILGSLGLRAAENSPMRATNMLAYDTSKTTLNAFTLHLAHELGGTPIKVNSAHPGWVKTAMGGPNAPTELGEGAETSVQLALLDENGPTGGYFHLGETLPW